MKFVIVPALMYYVGYMAIYAAASRDGGSFTNLTRYVYVCSLLICSSLNYASILLLLCAEWLLDDTKGGTVNTWAARVVVT